MSEEELPFEFMMNRLRLYTTFTIADYEAATGVSRNSILPTLLLAEQKKLMVNDSDTWCVTKLGHRYLNNLLEMFL